MLTWLSDTCRTIPSDYANILRFCTLTGLRLDEAFQSIHLIQNDPAKYLNKGRLTLEHFQYPSIFVRRTKKAFISLVTEEILKLAKDSPDCGYNAFRLMLKRRDFIEHGLLSQDILHLSSHEWHRV
ncbi:hypothetical protein NTE_00923 [Candidatus Nitrososphaera evergladensis SR1]|uniref:Uncharacterized protein n=1 Tax=Candidatus Nitrososphaera evergladensis SR1 TaxID=1459636 RepID=A0A075MUL3_9ARCH|nr:hypothetical protein NTE_00923 [Candidatus Nitrososphaera evergladensis SR1]